jgi:hypothetical protein
MSENNISFLAKHAKSSAALVSLGIHAVLIVVALSFVAVTVIRKEDKIFEAKPLTRPKMQLKKLQVPVNIKKKKMRQPKLQKRIVVQPKLNQAVSDIKMPEITGIKGGLGGAGGGLGGPGSLGFSMPEINLFGVKSKGEKVFIALDATAFMMRDEIGGVRAYKIIKEELVRMLEDLSSAVLFNVSVYDEHSSKMLFPQTVPANSVNVLKVKEWLEPLNAYTKNSKMKYGPGTTGPGGVKIDNNNQIDPLKNNLKWWMSPVLTAMKNQVDTVFVMTCHEGYLVYQTGATNKTWNESQYARWRETLAKARQKLAEDNAERAKRGEPSRVIPDPYNESLVRAYFPGTPEPPMPVHRNYTAEELFAAVVNTYDRHMPANVMQTRGLGRKRAKNEFTINVVQFTAEDGAEFNRFRKIVRLAGGDFRQLQGLEAVESYVGIGND